MGRTGQAWLRYYEKTKSFEKTLINVLGDIRDELTDLNRGLKEIVKLKQKPEEDEQSGKE